MNGLGDVGRVRHQEPGRVITVVLFVFATCMLVLWAYAHAEKVAYVAGLRQLSIVLGVLGGLLLLKESGRRLRVFASTVIVAGRFLIGLAGRP